MHDPRAPDRAESGLVRIARGARDKEPPFVGCALLISITATAGTEIMPHNVFAAVRPCMNSMERDVRLGTGAVVGIERRPEQERDVVERLMRPNAGGGSQVLYPEFALNMIDRRRLSHEYVKLICSPVNLCGTFPRVSTICKTETLANCYLSFHVNCAYK